jgi:uncharacterized protein (TIGR03790 family)
MNSGTAMAGRWSLIALCALLAAPDAALAQSGSNVALVINDDSAASRRIGAHYAAVRAVPDGNVIRLRTPTDETITRERYQETIERPITQALSRAGLQDRILYIVLTKDVPLRIDGTEGVDGTMASVDSELALLYRRMTGQEVPVRGRIPNPYFLSAAPVEGAARFTRRLHDIYLVTRLDAFTTEEAIALIDRAQTPRTDGRFVLDQWAGIFNDPSGDVWLAEASKRLAARGFAKQVILERTRDAASGVDGVIGYSSWGAEDPANRARTTGMRFLPGALATRFAGADARTFREPPADWRPSGSWNDRSTWFEGAPQSLAGDLIREGITGTAGHIAEPTPPSAVRPQILFPAYMSGFNLAEAFYLATPHLSWHSIVIGDPLCAVAPGTLAQADLEDLFDPETELPGFFSQRRRAILSSRQKSLPARVVAMLIRAETRLAKDDASGAREALEQAAEIAPRDATVLLRLALMYDQTHDFANARQRYEQVLALQKNNVIALNNLAYSLAIHAQAPATAKIYAERAVALAPNDPNIADTLGWVEHLLGNQAAATRLIAFAVRGAQHNPEIRLHAAFIYAAGQSLDLAAAELEAALRLAPELADRPDVQELRKRLAKQPPGAKL